MTVDGNGFRDALHFTQAPQRVVSLVPSFTESLFDLGLGNSVVGITDYCIYPENDLMHLPRLGGPKNPQIDKIIALNPDLVLANWEENLRQTVEELKLAGIPVWVTFPKSVSETLDVLWDITEVYRSETASMRLKTLEMTLDWVKSASMVREPVRYFCPIWYDQTEDGWHWWMTFNHLTYSHDLLNLIGGENVFAERERKVPLEADLGQSVESPNEGGDTRYPRVTTGEIISAQPEIILLPNEPYAFNEEHKEQLETLFSETPAARNKRIYLVDGSLITWNGTRLARALRELPYLFDIDP